MLFWYPPLRVAASQLGKHFRQFGQCGENDELEPVRCLEAGVRGPGEDTTGLPYNVESEAGPRQRAVEDYLFL